MVLALPPCAKKGVMFFIAMQTAGRRRFPIMGNRDIARPLMREILREISISPDEFVELLEKL